MWSIGVDVASIKIRSDIAGTVSKLLVQVGSQVAEDDTLILVESMKMEIPVTAPRAGCVTQLSAQEGDAVAEGDVLAVIEG